MSDTPGSDNAAPAAKPTDPHQSGRSVDGSQAHSAAALTPGSHLALALWAPLCGLL